MATDLVRIKEILDKAEKENLPANIIECLKRLGQDVLIDKEKRRRKQRPPAPEGGISLSDASRKYGIPHPTISRWVKAKYVTKLLDDGWIVYIKESEIAYLAKAYKADPGRGSWVIRKLREHKY